MRWAWTEESASGLPDCRTPRRGGHDGGDGAIARTPTGCRAANALFSSARCSHSISLSKPHCRIEFKGKRFEEAAVKGSIRPYFPTLFSCNDATAS